MMPRFAIWLSFSALAAGGLAAFQLAAEQPVAGVPAELPQPVLETTASPVAATGVVPNQEPVLLFTDQADNWHVSVMFSNKDMSRFEKILDLVKKKREAAEQAAAATTDATTTADDVLADLMPPAPPKPSEAPAFYLGTIIYKSKDEWVLWLAGDRYTPESTDGRVKVIAVNPHQATFEWAPEDLDYISPNWREAVEQNGRIQVRDGSAGVMFTLYPNQSFVSRAMKIIEGRADSTPLVQPEGEKKTPLDSLLTEGESSEPVASGVAAKGGFQRPVDPARAAADMMIDALKPMIPAAKAGEVQTPSKAAAQAIQGIFAQPKSVDLPADPAETPP